MRYLFLIIGTCSLLLAGPTVADKPTAGSNPLAQKAGELVKRMAGRLKPALTEALAEGGAVHAIEVCAVQAPEIAADVSGNGWRLSRVSLKHRNPDAAPDDWERRVLKRFQRMRSKGAPGDALVYSEQTGDGFRFAKAQIVEPLCLACHGEHLSPDVTVKLGELYPEDMATGYRLGDVRGMFSVTYQPQ